MDPCLAQQYQHLLEMYTFMIPIFEGKEQFTGFSEAIGCNSHEEPLSFPCSFQFSQTTDFSNTRTTFFSPAKLSCSRGKGATHLFLLTSLCKRTSHCSFSSATAGAGRGRSSPSRSSRCAWLRFVAVRLCFSYVRLHGSVTTIYHSVSVW